MKFYGASSDHTDIPSGWKPRGIKIAEITNRTIKAILFPRNQFEAILQRPELTGVGFYFLFGEAENGHEMDESRL